MKKVLFVFVVLFTLTACDNDVPNFYYPSGEGDRIIETSRFVKDSDKYCLKQCVKKLGKIKVSVRVLKHVYLNEPNDRTQCVCPILIDVDDRVEKE